MARRLTEVHLAFVFLTRLPMGRLPEDLPTLPKAAWAFPIVGLVVGAASGLVFWLASLLTPGLPAACLAIATGVLLTGALHEDGLADVADGFGGGATRERKLEIMRDSRIGSYGVVALVLGLGIIASTMATIPNGSGAILTFAAVGAISRAAMLIPMAQLPPAREDGLGHSANLSHISGVGLAIGIIVAVFINPWFLLATGIGVAAMILIAKRQIGGQTGDVLGATQKVTECLLWLAASATLAAA